jgi:hypothetical protein
MSALDSLRNEFETGDTEELVVVGGSLSTVGLLLGTDGGSLAVGLLLQVFGVGVLAGAVVWGSGQRVQET